ncbi:ATP-binding protein [Moorena producens JHB]|uniref:Circadian input-output histidine kinase CikA n=1 Tax=Moorena producens (strain JHB) TaxID=1454205 RepID=A0A1D9FXC0_MOOP1|nr:ATP-binding protein [Moorena producens]AOY79810.1 ATP-binding protein [Moorena producens JHB]
MVKPGPSSFRRILLLRLLLLSVPVLLTGVYVTYTKARSSLLDSARQNLTESAVLQAQRIQESIAALKANLVSASQAVALKSESQTAYQTFVEQLAQLLPDQIDCVQLMELQSKAMAASTCANQLLTNPPTFVSSLQQSQSLANRSQVEVTILLPLHASRNPSTTLTSQLYPPKSTSKLKLVLSAPVYNRSGQLQYALIIQSALLQTPASQRQILSSYPVVMNQQGTVLTHHYQEPVADKITDKINRQQEQEGLKRVLGKAIAQEQDFAEPSYLIKNSVELTAGYTSIPSPITAELGQKWVILAVTPVDIALAGLKEIQQVLLIFTCGLIGATLLATIYVARELARPLEQLRDYALNQSQFLPYDRIPQNFKIREVNQLSEAFGGMIERMKHWAEELEATWKEAQTANKFKNEFLANTSHELRTPLNAIIGCLRLIRDGFCDNREEEIDFLQRADHAAMHLLEIINDVLDMAKIEAGKLSVKIEPIYLCDLLDEVINLQTVPIQQKGLEFHTSDLHQGIIVPADPAKLKQVLINVVGNAVKFTDYGSITIKTRIEPLSLSEKKKTVAKASDLTSNSQVVIIVKDTGIGIDPTQQKKLFRPFVMVDGSTTRQCGGTGLGLAISRNLMEMMGGSITLFSPGEGKGSTVKITLPIIDGKREC